MSYLEALIRAQQGLSEAQPRRLSRYERPEASWEIEMEPSEGEIQRASFPPSGGFAVSAMPTPAVPAAPPPPFPGPATQSLRPAIAPSEPAPLAAMPMPGGLVPTTAAPAAAPVQPPASPRPPAADFAVRSTASSPPAVLGAAEPPPGPPLDLPQRRGRGIPVEALPLPRPPATAKTPGLTTQDAPLTPSQARPPAPAPASAPPPPPTPAQAADPAPPAILIEIGQIDIRLEAPPRAVPAPPAQRHLRTPALSLEEYLRGRP